MARRTQDFFDIEVNILESWISNIKEDLNAATNSTEKKVLEYYANQLTERLQKVQSKVAKAA